MKMPQPIKKLVDAKLGAYCARRIPPHARDQVGMGYKFRGNSVTLLERRPDFFDPDEWVDTAIAQFRFDPESSMWTLFWADRNSRWREYYDIWPSKNLDDLIEEVDDDPSGAFWG